MSEKIWSGSVKDGTALGNRGGKLARKTARREGLIPTKPRKPRPGAR